MRKYLAFAAITTMLLHSSAAFAAHVVGSVIDLKGDVTLVHAGGKKAETLHQGDNVSTDDTIATAKDSRVKIAFADKTEFAMEDEGRLTIDKFVYDPNKPAKDSALFTIFGGAFSYVSGLIDKNSKPDVTLKLESGNIGIRGTRLMGAVKGSERWIYLKTGKIDVYNAGGKVTLNPGEGTIMKSKQIAPQKPHIWKARELLWIKSKVTGHDIEW
jgi:hypothetical protein